MQRRQWPRSAEKLRQTEIHRDHGTVLSPKVEGSNPSRPVTTRSAGVSTIPVSRQRARREDLVPTTRALGKTPKMIYPPPDLTTVFSSAGKRWARRTPPGTLVAMILALAISPVVHGATAAGPGTKVWDSLYPSGQASSIATSRDGTKVFVTGFVVEGSNRDYATVA